MPVTIGGKNYQAMVSPSGLAADLEEGGFPQDGSLTVKLLVAHLPTSLPAKPKKMVTRNISLSGKDLPNFADVAAGAITAGAAFVTSVKQSEGNDDFNSFEVAGVNYPSAGAPT